MSRSASYKKVGDVYKSPYVDEEETKEEFVNFNQPIILEQLQPNIKKEEYLNKNEVESTLELQYKSEIYPSSGNPEVWGPAFWFTLHNGAAKYPLKASPIWADRMKGFILGMPVMIPCEKCSDHATSHIEANYERLDDIVSGRDKLFNFFVDFHNKVNRLYGKPQMSYEEAFKLYSGRAHVLRLEYK